MPVVYGPKYQAVYRGVYSTSSPFPAPGGSPLSMTHVGSGGAAADNIAFAAHQAGDVIIVTCRRGNVTPPSIPAAGGTVPTWVTVDTTGANAISMTTVMCVAVDGLTTSGVFTNAGQIGFTVLRPSKPVTLGAHVTANSAAVTQIDYPALTRDTTDGYCVRTATRGAAGADIGTAPTGWTNRITQPAAGSATLSLHTQDSAASNPVLDTVPSTSAAYLTFTFEIKAL